MNSQNLNKPLGTAMSKPFVWANIALTAVVPWLVVESMAGLAVGDPVFPEWFEILLLGIPAIALVTWQQWQQPIYPFSLWLLAKPQETLTNRELKILALVKQHRNGWYTTGLIALSVAVLMLLLFSKIYGAAPLAEAIAPFPSGLRLLGAIWAEAFWLASNFVLQSGIAALRIQLTAETELDSLQPVSVDKVKSSFTIFGWRSPQILKFLENPDNNETVEPEIEEEVLESNTSETQEMAIAKTVDIVKEPEITSVTDVCEEVLIALTDNVEEILVVESFDDSQEIIEVLELSTVEVQENAIASEDQNIDNVNSQIYETEEISEKSIQSQSSILIDNSTISKSVKKEINFLQKNNKFSISKKKKGFGKPVKIDQPISTETADDSDNQEELASDIIDNISLTDDSKKNEEYLEEANEIAPRCLITETLLDQFLEKIEEISRTDKSIQKVECEPIASVESPNIASVEENVDEFADLEELIERKFLPLQTDF
ncbi:MAG: hypothetical protein AUK48_01945 [Oscillatoriales cyanobacterium CG2_30_44_21]|nr:MAG: hypothetical protein AUK48_01945 [Oscillatoriales cyanobacterium CG2_30_44_21]